MAWAGIPNGLPALIVIPVGGRPPCHLCYSRRVSDVFPAVGGQIAPSWAGAAGIISGNCSQGKFSEELACDGWERWCGVGWAGRGWGSWRRQTGSWAKARRAPAASGKEGKDLHLSGRDAWRRWERQWASRDPGGKGSRMADGRGFGTPGPPAA